MSVMDSRPAPDAVRQRRREQRGWCWYDWANSVFPTSVTTVFLSLYLTSVATQAARVDTALNGPHPCPAGNALVRCDISLLGLTFPAGSLWGYLLSVATVVQVLVLPITGAIADRTQNKRTMLGGFAFGGSAATALLATMRGLFSDLAITGDRDRVDAAFEDMLAQLEQRVVRQNNVGAV